MKRKRNLDGQLGTLSQRARVALGAASTEHLLDLYRRGNFVYKVAHAKPGVLRAPPDTDLVQLGLEHAWSFVADGKADPRVVETVASTFDDGPDGMDNDDMAGGGQCVVDCLQATLDAIEDATPHSIQEAVDDCLDGVYGAVHVACDDDQRAEQAEQAEMDWQHKVLARLSTFGDEPITRAALEDLIGEGLAWREHLDAYAQHYG